MDTAKQNPCILWFDALDLALFSRCYLQCLLIYAHTRSYRRKMPIFENIQIILHQ